MRPELDDYFAANKAGWNLRTAVHKDSSFYNLKDFKAGQNVLTKIELLEVGDVSGKSLLHLQCHFGMDTLCWQRMGARCTGIDLSDKAIELARDINRELNLDSKFICGNVYDTRKLINDQFDIVFASYGTIGWLPDLEPWATAIAESLVTGGFFYIADFHPVIWMFDDELLTLKYSYFNREVIITEQKGTYADRSSSIEYREYGWNHPLSDIISALISAGLRIDFLHEFPYSPYNCFPNLVQGGDGMWRLPGKENQFPMVYSIKASKS